MLIRLDWNAVADWVDARLMFNLAEIETVDTAQPADCERSSRKP
jgi:hypothetical protein